MQVSTYLAWATWRCISGIPPLDPEWSAPPFFIFLPDPEPSYTDKPGIGAVWDLEEWWALLDAAWVEELLWWWFWLYLNGEDPLSGFKARNPVAVTLLRDSWYRPSTRSSELSRSLSPLESDVLENMKHVGITNLDAGQIL